MGSEIIWLNIERADEIKHEYQAGKYSIEEAIHKMKTETGTQDDFNFIKYLTTVSNSEF